MRKLSTYFVWCPGIGEHFGRDVQAYDAASAKRAYAAGQSCRAADCHARKVRSAKSGSTAPGKSKSLLQPGGTEAGPLGIAAHVHRFGDRCAIWVPPTETNGARIAKAKGGGTAYLTAKELRAFIRALNKVSRSIETVEFTRSEGTTWIVEKEIASDDRNT